MNNNKSQRPQLPPRSIDQWIQKVGGITYQWIPNLTTKAGGYWRRVG